MKFRGKIFKKQTLFIAFLMLTLIISIGTISANDLEALDSNHAASDMELNEINEIDESYNSMKSVLSSEDANLISSNQEDTSLNEAGNQSDSTQINTIITIQNDSIERGSSLTVKLKDNNGTGIANKTVIINIKNKTYEKITDDAGQASLQINLAANTYNTIISYEGDEIYESCSMDFNVTVYQMKTKINIINKTVVKERNLVLELLDKNNNPLASQNITITVNNKKYTNKTNSKGLAYFKISLATGKYDVNAKYNGNKNYNQCSSNFSMTVTKLKSNFIIPKTSIVRGYSAYIYLKDINGKAIPSAKVTIKFNGKSYSKTTNANGRISFKISTKGNYTLKLSYAGGESYLQRSQSFRIYSHNVKTKFIVTNYSVVRGKGLYIILRDSSNNNLPNKKVTFTILKKSYTKTTNANGKAGLQLTKVPGTYTIKLNFNGYYGYLKSQRTVKIKILKNTTADIIAKNQTRHLYGNSTIKYYVKLTDNNGNPIYNETIQLKVKCNNITTGTGHKITKKTIVLSSDNIIDKSTDKKLLNEMAKILRGKGYTAIVSGIGPNYHVSDVAKYSNVCVFSLVGGVDSGMFVDMASNYYQSYLKKNNNQFVLGCVAPPVYLNLGNMTWLKRAHDDDYSPASFKGLYYPGKYFNKVTKLDYVYGEDAEQLVNNFLKYAKYGKSIDLSQSTPKTTQTYKLTTNKNGNAYIKLPIGTYTITSSISNSAYKVDTVTSTLNVIK